MRKKLAPFHFPGFRKSRGVNLSVMAYAMPAPLGKGSQGQQSQARPLGGELARSA